MRGGVVPSVNATGADYKTDGRAHRQPGDASMWPAMSLEGEEARSDECVSAWSRDLRLRLERDVRASAEHLSSMCDGWGFAHRREAVCAPLLERGGDEEQCYG